MTTTAPACRPITLPEPWGALARAYGGRRALAAALKVDEKTVWRWATGENTPNDATRRLVDAMAKRRGVRAPWGGA